MTREPLILSDTAMVLLQQYVEIREHFMALLDAYDHIRLSEDNIGQWIEQALQKSPYYGSSSQIQLQLLHDIWLVWTYPDLVPHRQLEWHVVFDDTLMVMCEKRIAPRRENSFTRRLVPDRMYISVEPYSDFMEHLTHLYNTAHGTSKDLARIEPDA